MITLFELSYSFDILDKYIEKNIKTDVDLLKFMDSIEYGYFANGKIYKETDMEDDFGSYHLMSPLEVFKYRIGVCQDQSLFEYYVLNKLGYQNIKLFFIHQFYTTTHTFLIYQKENDWYYFENSFTAYRGIHGGFKTIGSIIELVKKQMVEHTYSKDGFLVKEQDPEYLLTKIGVNIVDYLKISGFNFKKM